MSLGQLLRLEALTAEAHAELLRVEITATVVAHGELLRVEASSAGSISLNAGPDRVVNSFDLVTIDVVATGTDPTAYQWQATDPSVVLVPAGAQCSFVAPAFLDGIEFDVVVQATAGTIASPPEYVHIIVLPHNEWTRVGGVWAASSEDEVVDV